MGISKATRLLIFIPVAIIGFFHDPVRATSIELTWEVVKTCSAGEASFSDGVLTLVSPDNINGQDCIGYNEVSLNTVVPDGISYLSFDWSYITTDDAVYDPPKYQLGATTNVLLAVGKSGSGTVTIEGVGETSLKFIQAATDSCCGTATLTISNLSLASPPPTTQETTTTLEETTTTQIPTTTVEETTTTIAQTTTTTQAPTTTVAPIPETTTTTTQVVTPTTQQPTTTTIAEVTTTTEVVVDTTVPDNGIIEEPSPDASDEEKLQFEQEVNIFDGTHDDYVPLGSTITVAQRRAVVAATAVLFILPVPVPTSASTGPSSRKK